MSTAAEALAGFARLARVLRCVRGAEPAGGQPEPLVGLGWLAARLAAEGARWDAHLADGEVATRRAWGREVERAALGGEERRALAALYWRWGVESADPEEGARWLQRAWEGMAHVLASASPPTPGWSGEPWSPALRRQAAQALLGEHRDRAHAALQRGEQARALMHWRVLCAWGQLGDAAAVGAFREALEAAWIAQARGWVTEGLERGVEQGYARATALLLEAAQVEPESARLQAEVVALGVRAAMARWALGDAEGFQRAASRLQPAARWLHQHPAALGAGPSEAHERAAQAWVCLAACAERPQEAVEALERALALHPLHPTAGRLLGQAQAAQAARLLGAGRREAAREAARAAQARGVAATPAWERLLAALQLPAPEEEADG